MNCKSEVAQWEQQMELEEIRNQLRRTAVLMEIGGFPPPGDPKTSWFGRVHWAGAGESWPTTGGKPMRRSLDRGTPGLAGLRG